MNSLINTALFSLLLIASQLSFANGQQDSRIYILVVGDSLSSGYGMELTQGWVHLLNQQLMDSHKVTIMNASISGETSGGGLARLPTLLAAHKPNIVIIELGGNDGLRGMSLTRMQQNLQKMIELSQDNDARVLLLGMEIPKNYGPRYTRQFHQVYLTLAAQHQTQLVPFLLAGVELKAEFIQRDGIHPSAKAQPGITENVSEVLLPMLLKFKGI